MITSKILTLLWHWPSHWGFSILKTFIDVQGFPLCVFSIFLNLKQKMKASLFFYSTVFAALNFFFFGGGCLQDTYTLLSTRYFTYYFLQDTLQMLFIRHFTHTCCGLHKVRTTKLEKNKRSD